MAVAQTFLASRNATWGPTLNYDYSGPALPLAGASIAMQLRLYPGQVGEAYLSIEAIPFRDVHLSGPFDVAQEQRRLTLEPRVTPAQLASLPGLHLPEDGSAQRFAFDIRITYADGASEILSSGPFVLSPGVTTA